MATLNVKTVELKGSNLIEASAGTGKTWSVSIMVLRLILEKEIPIEKILMVTFTKAAVAELESRIREFVRLGHKHVRGIDIDNTAISDIVGEPNDIKFKLLKRAVQSLDRLSVMTIHSFCQEIISNYPFEAGQSFENEIMADSGSFVEYYVNDFWRREINTLEDLEVFAHLSQTLSRHDMMQVVSRVLGEKEYVYPSIDREQTEKALKKLIVEHRNVREEYFQYIQNSWHEISSRDGGYHGNNLLKNNPSALDFAEEFLKKSLNPPGYFKTVFPIELAFAQRVIQAKDQLDGLTHSYKCDFYGRVIETIKNQVILNKEKKNIITYDDLISALHKAVMKKTINNVVLKNFDAVFIDEFQDTDKNQYEIFHTLFSVDKNKILFYIGDPKQSIYSWRKADIATYKLARNGVDSLHPMNNNFRSTGRLIEAMNEFLDITNPFYDEEIDYHKVGKGERALGDLTESGELVSPISINQFPNNDHIASFVASEILRLLTSDNIFINGESVKPSDIAVLVRYHYQSDCINEALSSLGIPSVTINDASVFDSPEAASIECLLETIMHPAIGLINKLLLNPCFGFKRKQIEELDMDEHLEIFRQLKKEWNTNGVYNMIFSFFDTYGLIRNCMNMGLKGQRSLSNYFQIAELLHQRAQKTKVSPDELLTWLNRQKKIEADEYEQRIESEDDAVLITTIHRSKGLTFKIVFAPFLDMRLKEDVLLFDFRDESGYKFTHTLTEKQEQLWRQQQEQENRRLLYVALTRAQYKNYICENTHFNSSSLKPFLKTQSPLFEINVEKEPVLRAYNAPKEDSFFTSRTTKLTTEDVKVPTMIHSFSALNSKQHPSVPFLKEQLTDYDQFIFQDLGRGAAVGTALHYIFEIMDFNNPDSWPETLDKVAGIYSNIFKDKPLAHLQTLVQHTMGVDISLNGESFRLSQITRDKMLPELQFYFSMEKVVKQKINDILNDEAELGGDADLQGLMTGFVDLVFEHHGKYYILDWKSNHLGNGLENYNKDGLDAAMKRSNYNLQYMIYTVAVKRWLESRIPDFDYDRQFGGVIYLFLRGMRQDSNTGVFYYKPPADQIRQLDKLLKGE